MFYIIGIGLNVKQLTLEAIQAIKSSNKIYIDNYTNIFSEGQISDLETFLEKKINLLDRKELEQELVFLKDNCCLLVIGNPFSATTHFTLIEHAKTAGIETTIIPGISVFSYRGIAGLSEYKFGKTTSIVYPEGNYRPTSFYDCIIDNLKINAHTLCLLDIKTDKNRFMTVKEACQILEDIDKENGNQLKDVFCVTICGAASKTQEIITFDFKYYKRIESKSFPQSLIVCGQLNDIERDGVNGYRC